MAVVAVGIEMFHINFRGPSGSGDAGGGAGSSADLQATFTASRLGVARQGSPNVLTLTGTLHDCWPTHILATLALALGAEQFPGVKPCAPLSGTTRVKFEQHFHCFTGFS